MTVMDVGEMRMRVRNGQMNMRMGMRFVAGIRKLVLMLMMFVVAVPMRMFEQVVSMVMLMSLSQMQPNTERHQNCGPQKNTDGSSGHITSDSATPNNGATEKYAPVRAVPKCRSATTNSTRLTP